MIAEFLKCSFICVASIASVVAAGVGIVRAINYIEDNVYAVKETMRKILYTVVALHLFLLMCGMSIWHFLFSLSMQYAFHCFFETYPVIKPEDPKFIYGVLGSLVNHFLLIHMFVKNHSGIITIIFSFVLIWVTPFCFFFTMSATDDVPFVRRTGRPTKTFAGMALDWVMNLGKKDESTTN